MKYIIFGGFDYAVRFEMDPDAIFHGIDYFVDNDPKLIGTTYLGKEIKHPDELFQEKKEDILILVGSIIYRTEITIQLKDMGFEEDKNFIWAINFCGDEKCNRLWKYIEWSDRRNNDASLSAVENGEHHYSRLKLCSRLIDFDVYHTIVDLGAANERIREFLPENIQYIPVDYIRYSDETIICDINKYEFPAINNSPEDTCIISIENLYYCNDWRWYLRKAAQACDCFILGLTDFQKIGREFRRTHWSRNVALFDHEVLSYMLGLGFDLTDSMDFRLKNTIYKFEKRKPDRIR